MIFHRMRQRLSGVHTGWWQSSRVDEDDLNHVDENRIQNTDDDAGEGGDGKEDGQ